MMRTKPAMAVIAALGISAILILVFAWSLKPQRHFSSNVPVLAMPEKVVKSENVAANKLKSHSFTVLLLGIDAIDQETSRADTIILAKVDLKKSRVSLISIPRDTRVAIEGVGYTKINHAHFLGEMKGGTQEGTREIIKAVSNLCQCDINYYLKINFEGFKEFIDNLGGIELELPQPVKLTYEGITLPAAKQKLDGRTTLNLVRERESLKNGDFGRQRNQVLVLKALANEVVELNNIERLPALVRQLKRDVIDMNFSEDDLASLALMLKDISTEDVSYTQIPGKDGYAVDPLLNRRLYYWIPDYKPEKIREVISGSLPD